MKKVVLLVVMASICAWWTLTMVVVQAAASVTPLVVDQTLEVNIVVELDLESPEADEYSTFLTNIRDAVKNSKQVCNLLTLKQSTPDYLKVVLKLGQGRTITLAVEAKNLYVWGYLNSGQTTARILNDAVAATVKTVLGAQDTKTVGFTGSYSDLERAAGAQRKNIELGLYKLQSQAMTIYKNGPSMKPRDEARFFIVAIQMVSEAARFKYIENLVKDTYTGVKPDGTTLDLEQNWGKISKAIFKSSMQGQPKCGSIDPVTIGGRVITTVAAISPDIGILNYVAQQTSQFTDESVMRSVAWVMLVKLLHLE